MPIRAICPGCRKTLRAADTLAGKRVRCPGCGGEVCLPARPPAPHPAADTRVPPAAPAASPLLDWWDDFDAGDQAGPMLPAAPTAAATTPPSAPPAVRPATPDAPRDPRPAPRRAWPGLRSLAFLLVLLPLALQMSGGQMSGGGDDVEARLQKMLDADPAFAARIAALEAAAPGEVDREDFFAACPDGRIIGAFLPRDTHAHWVFAALAAVAVLTLARLLFEPGEATLLQLFGALAITATAGILTLLIFQYLAELSLAAGLRGRGLVGVVLLVVRLIGFSYGAALDPANGFLPSFLGFTLGVGLCEEFIKLIPATGLMKPGTHDWRGACALGLASGIGFGVAEGIMYSADAYNGVAYGDVYLTRFMSCVGLHAIWTGAAAVLGAHQWRSFESADMSDMAMAAGKAIAVPVLLHGLYDTLLKRDMPGWALLVALASFAWLVAVIEHARWTEPR